MNNELRTNKGIGYFNLAKGIGMVFVVVVHSFGDLIISASETTSYFSGAIKVIGAGFMAMFFMISGYSFSKRKTKKFIKTQAKLLLKPYYITTGLILLTRIALAIVKRRSFWEHSGNLVLTYMLGLNAYDGGNILGIPICAIGIFWFLWTTFGSMIIYNIIVQIKSEKIQWVLVDVCIVGGYLLTTVSKVWPFAIPMALISTGYVAVGKLIKTHDLLERKLKAYHYFFMLIPVLISLVWGQADISSCEWKLGLLDVLSTFILGFLLLRFFAWINKHHFRNKIIEDLEKIGFNSIWILCIHGYENTILPWYRFRYLFEDSLAVRGIVIFLLRCIVIYIVYQVVMRFRKVTKIKKKKIILEE